MTLEELPNLLKLIMASFSALGTVYAAIKARKFVSVRQTRAAYQLEGLDPEVKEALRNKMNEDIIWRGFSIRYNTQKGKKLITLFNQGGISSRILEPASWNLNDELQLSSPRWNRFELLFLKLLGIPCLIGLVWSIIGIFASSSSPNALLTSLLYASTGITSVLFLIPILHLRKPLEGAKLIVDKYSSAEKNQLATSKKQ